MDPSTGGFIHYRHDPRDDATLSNSAVLALHEDRRGNLWIGTGAGLNVLEKATGRITRFTHDPADPHSLGHDYVSAIAEDRSGVLWVASSFGSGLSALDVKTGRFTRYSFHAEEPSAQGLTGVNGLYVDRDGVLWLCTMDRGLLKLDPEARRFVRYRRDPAEPNTLPNDTVLSLFEDAEGVMWVGTQSGVVPVIRKPPPFVNYTHSASEPEQPGRRHDLVRARRQARRPVDRDGDGPPPARSPDAAGSPSTATTRANPDSLSYDKVSGMREDPSGALWIGTYGGGLDRFDPATGRFVHYRHDPNDPHSLDSDLVLSVFLDRQGVLWVGTAGRRAEPVRSRRPAASRSTGAQGPNLLPLDIRGPGRNPLARGLRRSQPRSTLARSSSPSMPTTRAIPAPSAATKCGPCTRIGRAGCGSAPSSGLNELDRARGTFTSITRKDGLAGNSVRAILEDGAGISLAGHGWRAQPVSPGRRGRSATSRSPTACPAIS